MIPYEQALGDSGKEKLPIKRINPQAQQSAQWWAKSAWDSEYCKVEGEK